MTPNEKGSATLHSLFAALLLITALAAATLWSTISTARHRLSTAADLTALSAGAALSPSTSSTTDTHLSRDAHLATAAQPSTATELPMDTQLSTSCAAAARIAAVHKVQLIACHSTPTAVTVEVALQIHLPFANPILTATARAGPV
ncbi:pilus assembly protein TadG-related protein [Kribbella sp. NPDC055071]